MGIVEQVFARQIPRLYFQLSLNFQLKNLQWRYKKILIWLWEERLKQRVDLKGIVSDYTSVGSPKIG